MHHLGPDRPLTPLLMRNEVGAAAVGGVLRSSQWCEQEATLPPRNKKTNTELARG